MVSTGTAVGNGSAAGESGRKNERSPGEPRRGYAIVLSILTNSFRGMRCYTPGVPAWGLAAV